MSTHGAHAQGQRYRITKRSVADSAAVHSDPAFMKTIQCPLAVAPILWPKSGFSCVNDRIVFTDIRCSFHLKINVPYGIRTRKHSANPRLISSFQSIPPDKVPYFFAMYPDVPLNVCGGSNTTSVKVLSGNGSALKSAKTSGSTTISRTPCRESAETVSRRLSTNKVRPSALSNQNIRGPLRPRDVGGRLLRLPITA